MTKPNRKSQFPNQPKNGWDLFYDEVLRQKNRDEALEAIATIVVAHPEWIQEEPELEKHLTVLEKTTPERSPENVTPNAL